MGFGARGVLFGEEVEVAADGGEGVVEGGGGAGGHGATGLEAGVAEGVGVGAALGTDFVQLEAEGGTVGPEAAADGDLEFAGGAVGASVDEVVKSKWAGGLVPLLEDIVASEQAGDEQGDESIADFMDGESEEAGGGLAGFED